MNFVSVQRKRHLSQIVECFTEKHAIPSAELPNTVTKKSLHRVREHFVGTYHVLEIENTTFISIFPTRFPLGDFTKAPVTKLRSTSAKHRLNVGDYLLCSTTSNRVLTMLHKCLDWK